MKLLLGFFFWIGFLGVVAWVGFGVYLGCSYVRSWWKGRRG